MKKITIDDKEYQLDVARAKELGVLVPNRPRSWVEYCAMTTPKPKYNKFDGKDGSAFAALGKLIHLRNAWWGKWEPNWDDITQIKYCITIKNNKAILDMYSVSQVILAFPTKEMAEEFYECFKKLIEQAKMFL